MSAPGACVERACEAFARVFDAPATHAASAPGRVNLIGEHTDYTGGYVLPIAIDLRCAAVGRVAATRTNWRVHSTDLDETVEFDPHAEPDQLPRGSWARYVAGVAAELIALEWNPPPIELCAASDLPLGGGLSSSAALEVATATVLESICGRTLSPVDKALLCQRAEHAWPGVPCGVMDQMVSVMAHEGHALLIDCRNLRIEHVPMPPADQATLLVFNSNVKHGLADGEYAKRRAASESAARALGVDSLRDASIEMVERDAGQLSDEQTRCARHVISENARTQAAAQAMQAGDLASFGRLMDESHASLRDGMRVSCPELDTLVELASACEGVYGARMTGGGFGGCAIALVQPDRCHSMAQSIAHGYKARYGRDCSIIPARASAGAGRTSI